MILKPQKFRYPIKGHPLARGLVGCWLMNEGCGSSIFDSSGNAKTGTFIDNVAWVQGKFGPCLTFDGTLDRVSLPVIPIANLNQYSLSIWTKTTATSYRIAISQSTESGDPVGNIYLGQYSDNKAVFRVRDDAGNVALISGYGPTVNDGLWHHIAGVRYAVNDFRLFLDGKLLGISTTSVGTSANIINANIGVLRTNSYYYYWLGQLDYAIIRNCALSASKIAQLYREPFAMFGRRQIWQSGAGAPPAFKPYWARQCNNLIGAA